MYNNPFSKYQYAEGLSTNEMMVVAMESLRQMGWLVTSASPSLILASTHNPMFSWADSVSIRIDAEKIEVTSIRNADSGFDWGKSKRNTEQFLQVYSKLRRQLSNEELSKKYQELLKEKWFHTIEITSGPVPEKTVPQRRKPQETSPIKDFFLKYRLTPWTLIVFLSSAILLWSNDMHLFPYKSEILDFGASKRLLSMDGQLSRIFTALFIPQSPFELFINLVAVVFAGILLEHVLGVIYMLLVLILSGLMASLYHIVYFEEQVFAGFAVMVMGLYGALAILVIFTSAIDKEGLKTSLASILIFLTFHLYKKNGIISEPVCLVVGFVSGAVLAVVMLPSMKDKENRTLQMSTPFLILLFYGILSAMLFFSIPQDMIQYRKILAEIKENEKTAIQSTVYAEKQTGRKAMVLWKGDVIRNWNKNIRLMNDLRKLQLPDSLKENNEILIQYYAVQSNRTRLIINNLERPDDYFTNKMNRFDEAIAKLKVTMAENK